MTENITRSGLLRCVVKHPGFLLMSIGVTVLLSPVAKADTATVQIAASGLPAYTSTVNNENVYVGPTQSTVTMTGQQPAPVVLWCDDFVHTTYVPLTYQVNVSTFDSLIYVRFPGDASDTQLQKYKEAAWLMLQFPTITHNNATVGALQTAIWHVFDSNVVLTSDATTWMNTVDGQNLTNYDFSSVVVLTPVCTTDCANSPQEFLGQVPPVPEPSSILFLGTGLLVVGTVLRKRLRSL